MISSRGMVRRPKVKANAFRSTSRQRRTEIIAEAVMPHLSKPIIILPIERLLRNQEHK